MNVEIAASVAAVLFVGQAIALAPAFVIVTFEAEHRTLDPERLNCSLNPKPQTPNP